MLTRIVTVTHSDILLIGVVGFYEVVCVWGGGGGGSRRCGAAKNISNKNKEKKRKWGGGGGGRGDLKKSA